MSNEDLIHDEHGPAAPAPHSPQAGEWPTDTTGDTLAEFLTEQFITLGSGENLAAAIFIADSLRSAYPALAAAAPEPKPGFKPVPNPMLAGSKLSNPKDGLGILKVALSCVSWPVLFEVGIGMLEGALKYGRHNYRVVGVRASVYVDATLRHVGAFWEGEDEDPDSAARLSHITKAITSLTVLRDSMIAGNWVDDRPPVTAPRGWMAALNDKVKALLAQYPEPVPPYTQAGMPKYVGPVDFRTAEEESVSEAPSEVG
jgi:hypothetical protein